MKVERGKLYGIIGTVALTAILLSSCVSTGLIAGSVAADAAVSAVRGKLAEGERVTDLGNGQYLITIKAPAMSLGERFKAIADETAHQNGYETYNITSTSVSQGSDSGSDLSLLTGIIVCRRDEPKPESQASPPSSVEPKTEMPSSPPSSVEPKSEPQSSSQSSPQSPNSAPTSAK